MLRIFLLFLLVAHATILPGKAIGQERQTRHARLAQLPDSDSVRREIDREPPFGIYKDNYFVTGSSFSHGGPNKYNSDAKFQISLRYRLIQGVLPYNTYLFLTYTQKSFWEMQYEHESNGRDSIWSRSWNRISLLGQIFFSRNWSMEVKLWAPFSLDDPNRDIVYYNGYGLVAANYKSDNERLWLSACITKRGGWNLNANTELEVAWRAIRKCNLYLTLQYYNGYGEGLLAYNQFHNYLRIRFVIKPRHVSIF